MWHETKVVPGLSTLPSQDQLALLSVPTATTDPAEVLSIPGLLPLMPPSLSPVSLLSPIRATNRTHLKQARSLPSSPVSRIKIRPLPFSPSGSPAGLAAHTLLGSTPKAPGSPGLKWSPKFAYLPSSQVMLMSGIQGPLFRTLICTSLLSSLPALSSFPDLAQVHPFHEAVSGNFSQC